MVQIIPLARTVAKAIILRNTGGVVTVAVTVAPLSKDGRAMEGIPLRAPTTEAIQLTLHREVVIRKTRARAIIRSRLTHKPTTPSNILNNFNRLLRNKAVSVQPER